MRTPGRCMNHSGCWLANGDRDIWLNVGEDFACPVCGAGLCVPPLGIGQQSGAQPRRMAMAVLAGCAIAAVAGAAGFALVHKTLAPVQTASRTLYLNPGHLNPAPRVKPETVLVAQAVLPSCQGRSVTQEMVVASVPSLSMSWQAPADSAQLPADQAAPGAAQDASYVPQPVPPARTMPAAEQADAEPAPRPVLPISFGQPVAPEDATADAPRPWHHKVEPERHNIVLPAPGWGNGEAEIIS